MALGGFWHWWTPELSERLAPQHLRWWAPKTEMLDGNGTVWTFTVQSSSKTAIPSSCGVLFTVAQLSRRNIHPWSQGRGEVWQELPWSCGQGCESLQRLPHFFHGVGPAPEVPPERASRCCWSKSRIKRDELCLVLSHRTNISIYRWTHTWLLCTLKCHCPLHFYELYNINITLIYINDNYSFIDESIILHFYRWKSPCLHPHMATGATSGDQAHRHAAGGSDAGEDWGVDGLTDQERFLVVMM